MDTSMFSRQRPYNTTRRSAVHVPIASRNGRLLVRFLRIVLINLTWLSIGACDQGYQPRGPVERSWTEDVLLDDGSTLLVKRYVAFKETNAWPSGGAYNAVETASVIRFTGQLASMPPWNQPLMALVLYQDADEWVVVATTTSCEVWRQRKKPKPPYWEFRFGKGMWREVSLSQKSIGRPANLFSSYHPQLTTAHITAGERRRLEADIKPFESMSLTEKKYRVIIDWIEDDYCNS